MTVQCAIHDFWFGDLSEEASVPQERLQLWFGGKHQTDQAIRQKFLSALEQASRGEFDSWVHTARGALTLILLLDQFPRNIFRGNPQAYAYDHKALTLALKGISRKQDRELMTVERAFFYLPLEHSEDRQIQEQSVKAFEKLYEQAPEHLKPMCAEFLDYARRHREVIERFGRFPHRNKVLGRVPTEEETAFLKEPGSSF